LRLILHISRDRKEYSDTDHERKERRSSIADKGKGYPSKRYDIEVDTDIDKCLYEYEEGDSESHILSKCILDGSCNRKTSMSNQEVDHEDKKSSQKSEFLDNY
jgi:hypothetical protein